MELLECWFQMIECLKSTAIEIEDKNETTDETKNSFVWCHILYSVNLSIYRDKYKFQACTIAGFRLTAWHQGAGNAWHQKCVW